MRNRLLAAGLAVLLLASTSVGALAYNRHVTIFNNTSYTITEFYASSVGVDIWQEDILGNSVLESGYQVDINIDDGTGYCKYDFKAVFEDGTSTVSKAINVCEVGTYTYND